MTDLYGRVRSNGKPDTGFSELMKWHDQFTKATRLHRYTIKRLIGRLPDMLAPFFKENTAVVALSWEQGYKDGFWSNHETLAMHTTSSEKERDHIANQLDAMLNRELAWSHKTKGDPAKWISSLCRTWDNDPDLDIIRGLPSDLLISAFGLKNKRIYVLRNHVFSQDIDQ